MVVQEPVGEGADAGQVGQVERSQRRARRPGTAASTSSMAAAPLVEIAHGHRHRRAVGGQRPRGLEPESRRGAGDEDAPTGEVDARPARRRWWTRSRRSAMAAMVARIGDATARGCSDLRRGRRLCRPVRGQRALRRRRARGRAAPGWPGAASAIVTCIDSRIDPLAVFGLVPGDAKILRNAGARVTDGRAPHAGPGRRRCSASPASRSCSTPTAR